MDIAIHGCAGRMGRTLTETIKEEKEHRVVFGVDTKSDGNFSYPVFKSFKEANDDIDVVIDFSHYSAIKDLLGWCILHGKPVVIATTNLSTEEYRIIQEAGKQIAVFQSPNMSIGINALCKGLPVVLNALDDSFDVGIFEVHHRNKKDAPSGTAYLLKDALNSKCSAVTSLRIGGVPGEHKIIFAGPHEVLELTHTAYSPKIFAIGAIKAAAFIIGKKPGLYSMDEALNKYMG